MHWPARRPPSKSRRSSPTNLSTACSICRLAPQRLRPEEVLMVDGPLSPPGFPRTEEVAGGGDTARDHEEYRTEPLTSLQREELRRRNMDALHTPIVGETPEARALEEARLANLAERTRLENLQRALDERARPPVAVSSRRRPFQPPTQVYRTPIQNLAAAARIAESIQPS